MPQPVWLELTSAATRGFGVTLLCEGNVYIAEERGHENQIVLTGLHTVQELPGEGQLFFDPKVL